MELKKIKKVETLEDFRKTLLKLFYSNQNDRSVYVSINRGEEGGIDYFVPVDNINSFQDILNLSNDFNVRLTLKVDFSFMNKKNNFLQKLIEVKGLKIYEDEEEFLEKVKFPKWYRVSDLLETCIIKDIFNEKYLTTDIKLN